MNEPVEAKLAVEATLSVEVRASIVCAGPLTVVPVVEVTIALSSGLPVQPVMPVNLLPPRRAGVGARPGDARRR